MSDNIRVIELRTHGVSGTPPESMLDARMVVQVGGDDRGRFFQACDVLGNARPRVDDLVVDGRRYTRYREGYHWGKMTSGGLKQALWAVLLPFALVNLGQWMVPPTSSAAGNRAVAVLRGLVRSIGIALTVLIMVQLTVIAADVVGVQCLAREAPCLATGWPVYFHHHPLARVLAVLAVIVVPVLAIGAITAVSARQAARKLDDCPAPSPEFAKGDLPPARIALDEFLAESSSAPARTLHWIAGISGAAMVLAGGTRAAPDAVGRASWWLSLTLLVLALVVNAVFDDPRGSGGQFTRGGRILVAAFGNARWRRVWGIVVLANLAAAALFPYLTRLNAGDSVARSDETRHFGLDIGVDNLVTAWVFVLAVLWVATAVTTSVVARWSRRDFPGLRDLPNVYRIWLWGNATTIVGGLACLLGAGFGVGATQLVRGCVTTGCLPAPLVRDNPPGPAVPAIYHAIGMTWGLLGLAVVVGLVSLAGRGAYARRHPNPVATLVQGAEEGVAWFIATLNQQTARVVAGVVVVAAAAGVWATNETDFPIWRWLRHGNPQSGYVPKGGLAMLEGFGMFLLAVILAGLLASIWAAYRRPDGAGRSLGVLWDLASFWPAEGHPIVPPCYARTAIVDLVHRVHSLADDHPDTRVVLCGHSQGSLLMYATALRLMCEPGSPLADRIGLVTYGSQLQWAYGRGFPNMLSFGSHRAAMFILRGRWLNLIRFTDMVGGPVLSWNRSAGHREIRATVLPVDGSAGAQVREPVSAPRSVRLGNEYWLPDPVLTEPVFPARKHSEYTLDRQWDAVVAAAAGLTPTDPGPL
ncbi:MAG: hypothetical protein U0Q20_04985 [Mycobacterium sp.]